MMFINDHSPSLQSLNGVRKLLVSLTLLANLFVFTLVGYSLYESYHVHEQRAAIQTQNLTTTLVQNLSERIRAIDLAMLAAKEEFERQLRHGGIEPGELNDFLVRHQGRLPELDGLRITDAKGNIRYGEGVDRFGRISLADRDYFVFQQQHADGGRFLGRPVQSRVTGNWVAALSYRLNDKSGRFAGMVYATVRIDELTKAFSRLDLGRHGSLLLRDADLGLITRYPVIEGPAGMIGNVKTSEEFRKLVQSGQTAATYVANRPSNDIVRLYSYQRLPNAPWYVIAGMARTDYLEDWYGQAARYLAFAALFLLVSLLAARVVWGGWKQQFATGQKLTETRDSLQTVIDHSTDWIYWRTANRQAFKYISPACETLTGYSLEEFLEDPGLLDRIIHPEDRQRWLDHLSGRDACEGDEYRIVTKSGEIRWIGHSCRPVLGKHGENQGRRGSNVDITRHKQAEDDLRLAATAFETQEAITITDADNRIIRVNRAFTRVTGYSPEEVIGRSPAILQSGRHDEAFYREMWRSLNTDGCWQGEIWNRRKNGEIFPEWMTVTAVRNEAGAVCNYVGAFLDISHRKQAENQIQQLAFYDPLTGLPNRSLLLERIGHAITKSARQRTHGALLFIDLDNFKTLNDTLGHDQGDRLLSLVAERLQTCLRESDTVARLGGDEFVVMLEGLDGDIENAANQAEIIGEKIRGTLDRTDEFSGLEHHNTPSIGITLFHGHDHSIDELLKRGDLAMYEAKAAGGNALRFFDPAMQAVVETRARLEAELRKALKNEEFELHYQLQYDAAGQAIGAEALLRWRHPERGLVPPGNFIPLAESSGLILPIGEWVLNSACKQLAAWQAEAATRHLRLAVNVSARQFRQSGFADQVRAALDASGAVASGLKLEITETLLVEDVDEAIEKMECIRAMGVGFALDDFGTGYSSLAYLKRLPLEQLKIDRSFVSDMLDSPNDSAIICTVLALGQSLGMTVIAEGVETAAQSDFLARLGCNGYQGYYFGRPAPVEALVLSAPVSA